MYMLHNSAAVDMQCFLAVEIVLHVYYHKAFLCTS